jgi:hypothetical protein
MTSMEFIYSIGWTGAAPCAGIYISYKIIVVLCRDSSHTCMTPVRTVANETELGVKATAA